MESNCGIYLKWFNANGGYSYWLFDKFYSDTTSTKTIDEIVGKYDNLKNVNSFSTITGKEANATYKIQTRFNVLYKEYITSILTSPSVEMYVHQTPFNQIDVNKFIAVKLSDGSFTFNNKNSNFKLDLTITLPEILTVNLMESERLYINNKLIELSTQTQQFARTLQVNDILSLDDRQTNFTKNIRIARTPSNVLAMDFLGVVGNSSNLPYQTNTVNII
jgi:hypothetical protein